MIVVGEGGQQRRGQVVHGVDAADAEPEPPRAGLTTSGSPTRSASRSSRASAPRSRTAPRGDRRERRRRQAGGGEAGASRRPCRWPRARRRSAPVYGRPASSSSSCTVPSSPSRPWMATKGVEAARRRGASRVGVGDRDGRRVAEPPERELDACPERCETARSSERPPASIARPAQLAPVAGRAHGPGGALPHDAADPPNALGDPLLIQAEKLSRIEELPGGRRGRPRRRARTRHRAPARRPGGRSCRGRRRASPRGTGRRRDREGGVRQRPRTLSPSRRAASVAGAAAAPDLVAARVRRYRSASSCVNVEVQRSEPCFERLTRWRIWCGACTQPTRTPARTPSIACRGRARGRRGRARAGRQRVAPETSRRVRLVLDHEQVVVLRERHQLASAAGRHRRPAGFWKVGIT